MEMITFILNLKAMLTTTRLLKRKVRKTTHCLNCNHAFEHEENYCPSCGQFNSDTKVSFGVLLDDFAKDYFTFDSKLFRSLFPLLFKPGFLTKEYAKGRRMHYIPPLRMYLFVSFIFFLFNTPSFNVGNNGKIKDTGLFEVAGDSATTQKLQAAGKEISDTGMEFKNVSFERDNSFERIIELSKNETLSPRQILLKAGTEPTARREFMVGKLQKIMNNDVKSLIAYIFSHLPFMMLLVLPFFAMIMKLVYIRSNTLYIEHLTHLLHLQTFVFLAMLFTQGINSLSTFSISGYVTLLTLGYVLISLKKVYRQRWAKTAVKATFLLILYPVIIAIFFAGNVIISLITV
jgi:hypothetical protein